MSVSLTGFRTAAFCRRRFESTLSSLTRQQEDIATPFTHWSRVIREAEKIVGYPTSFMNLRWLLSDEVANMALHLRKLVGSDHPLLKTARNLLYNEHNNLQPWGLVILLLSKSVKHKGDPVNLPNESNGVLHNQRLLAELTEMIRTGHLIHKGLVNICNAAKTKKNETTLFANKLGLLTGDYMLVTANGMLAKIRNQNLSYIISSALRDLSESEFFGERDHQNFPLPSKPIGRSEDTPIDIPFETEPLSTERALGKARMEWTFRNIMSGASLLGRGCQGAMLLAEQPEDIQRGAYLFGCHLGLAWQAADELQSVSSNNKEKISLVSAPVLFALEDNNALYNYIQEARDGIHNIDYCDLKMSILKTDALERTKHLYEDHKQKAKEFVDNLGVNDSLDALRKIMKAL